MDQMKHYMEEGEKNLLHTYNRYPIVLDRGEGVYLYDLNGKKYLDFCSGIGVFALGYGNSEYNQSLKDQIDKLIHTSNYYYNVPAITAAAKLKECSGMDRVFFTNSGTEAVEGAIKAARKYAYLKDGCRDHEIIAMEHSFHGRTMGALAVTGTPKYREPFEPLIGNIRFAEMNDLDSVKACVNDKTCAILLETVQGEGGIHPAQEEFLRQVRSLCDERDILLILDEIQCGMGRCGAMFAWQLYGVRPDIMTTAKALGGGIPVGAFLMTEKTASASLVPGDHGTTYGGNPLACAAVNEVYRQFEERDILENVKKTGKYLYDRLEEMKEACPQIIDHRGMGFMQGLEFDRPVAPIVKECLKEGLVIISAGANVLRMVPPLITDQSHVDEMIRILNKVVKMPLK